MSEKNTRQIHVPCTEKQYETIRKKAEHSGMSPQEFALFTMLNSRISVRIGTDPLLSHLERLADLVDRAVISGAESAVIKARLIQDIDTTLARELRQIHGVN